MGDSGNFFRSSTTRNFLNRCFHSWFPELVDKYSEKQIFKCGNDANVQIFRALWLKEPSLSFENAWEEDTARGN